METLKLKHPIFINGKERTELTYDADQITARLFCEAEVNKFDAAGKSQIVTTYEFDHGLHVYLGMAAIIAVNPDIDVKDLERLKGRDLLNVANIGRNFIFAGQGEESDQETSGDTSEATHEPSTQTSES